MLEILRLVLGLLPASAAKNRLLTWSGRRWTVAPTARIGPTVFWRVGELSVGDRTVLGIGNVFRNMRRVSLGDDVEIQQFNEFTATAQWVDQADPEMAGALVVDDQGAVTGRHFMECSGGVSIGSFSVIGGFRSMLITRSMDLEVLRQKAAPIRVGEHSMIASGTTIVPGVRVGDRCIVGAGSVVAKDLLEPETIYAGNPARPTKTVDGDARFFTRTENRAVPRDVVRRLQKDARRR